MYGRDLEAFQKSLNVSGKPVMMIAGTVKAKDVTQVEDQNGRQGKALKEEDLQKALQEIGEVDESLRGEIRKPEELRPEEDGKGSMDEPSYNKGDSVPTRNAYGNAMVRIFSRYPSPVSLDTKVSNPTRAEYFKKRYPDNFFEMFIAEQNMVGAALGWPAGQK